MPLTEFITTSPEPAGPNVPVVPAVRSTTLPPLMTTLPEKVCWSAFNSRLFEPKKFNERTNVSWPVVVGFAMSPRRKDLLPSRPLR